MAMADDAVTESLIAEIRFCLDELADLDVKREYINFGKMKTEQLEDELDARRRQVFQRKKFLKINFS